MCNAYTYHGNPAEVQRVEHVPNWSRTVGPFMADELVGMSEPLHYRFSINKDGGAIVSYKSHCEKPAWKGELDLISKSMPLPFVGQGGNMNDPRGVLQLRDVASIPYMTGEKLMAICTQKLLPKVPSQKRQAVLAEWRVLANEVDSANAGPCPTCSTIRKDCYRVLTVGVGGPGQTYTNHIVLQ